MTIDMSTTRTDLALESVQAACSGAETGTISGVRSRERTREGYAVTDIRVEDEDGAQALGKPVGRYVTVDLGPYFRREADYFDRGVRCLAGELAALLPDGTNGGVTADIHFRVRRVYRYDGETVAVSDVRY